MAGYRIKFASDFTMDLLQTLYVANAWKHELGIILSGIIFVKWDPQVQYTELCHFLGSEMCSLCVCACVCVCVCVCVFVCDVTSSECNCKFMTRT
jgi:hypothetical protein